MNVEVINIINTIIRYLISPPPPFDQWIAVIRIIFLSVSFLLLLSIIFFIFRTSWLRFRYLEKIVELLTYKPFGAGKIVKKWEKLKHRLEVGMEAERKLVIIEADVIFSEILEKMGYIGETFEARTKRLTTDILPNLLEILEAHKIRNNIVHDPNYKLSIEQARKIILIYEKALIDLQVL